MKTLDELFDDFTNDCNVALSIAYLIKNDIEELKLNELSHNQLLDFMQKTSNKLDAIPERMVQASESFQVLRKYLQKHNIEFNKKFDDVNISNLIKKDWKRMDKICENNRKLQAKQSNKRKISKCT